MAANMYDLDKYYFSPNGAKTTEDVKNERFVAFLVLAVLVGLTIGLPAFINLGKSLFGIQPVIY